MCHDVLSRTDMQHNKTRYTPLLPVYPLYLTLFLPVAAQAQWKHIIKQIGVVQQLVSLQDHPSTPPKHRHSSSAGTSNTGLRKLHARTHASSPSAACHAPPDREGVGIGRCLPSKLKMWPWLDWPDWPKAPDKVRPAFENSQASCRGPLQP